MPELCRFYGIVISMLYHDHAPPHFHARYGDYRAVVTIAGEQVTGDFPPRAAALVLAWGQRRKVELLEAWARVQRGEAPGRIPPLE